MRRGRTQAIYRYLPETVVDHTDTQTIAKVANWRVREVREVNMDRIVEKVSRKMNYYKDKWGYSREIRTKDFIVLEPTGIEVELFPLTFTCRKCGRIASYRSLDHLRKNIGRSNYICPQKDCTGTLDQLDLVHYHTCGKIESLSVSGCQTHKYKSIILEKHGSDSIRKWRWVCTICGQTVGRIGRNCKECKSYMRTSPFRKGDVFYPQSVIMINVPGIRRTLSERKMLLAMYLGFIHYDEMESIKGKVKSEQEAADIEKKIQELRDDGLPEKYLKSIRKKFIKKNVKTKDSILDQLDRIIDLDEIQTVSSSNIVHDFIEIKNLEFVHSLKDIEKEAKQTSNPAAPIIAMYPDKFREIGVKNAWVVGDFPVLRSVFGYTRGSANPRDCTLRSFPLLKDQFPGKTPIYSVATETEAILIEMDRGKILQWLLDNDIARDAPVGMNVEIQKAWFLNNINPDVIPIYDEIPIIYPKVRAVYNLLHTISHSLMNYASSLIGLDKSSLAEIIFPNIPAFIIYSNQATDFQLGGMFTLMESSVIPWIDSTVNGIERCLYDPVCMDSGGSCHACLFASEITCEHFNRDLRRDVLVGRKGKFVGFWEHLYE